MSSAAEYAREQQSGQNGHGHHEEDAPVHEDDSFHFSDNPGRRNGERWHIRLPHESQIKRLYGRATQPEPAEPENLRGIYQNSLSLIAKYRPLRAAALEDLISRTEYAFKRYGSIKKEEEWYFQNINEDARNANEWIDNRVGLLRTEREAAAKKWEEEIALRRDALAIANEEAAAAHTAGGNPMPYRYRGQEDEPNAQSSPMTGATEALSQTAAPGQAAAQATAAQVTEAVQTARGLLARLRGGLKMHAEHAHPAGEAPKPEAEFSAAGRSAAIPPRRAYPEAVSFPLEDGEAQSMPLETIAMQQGLPFECPTAKAMQTKMHSLGESLALLACGSIFGISLGFLVGVLNLNLLSIRPETVWPLILLVSVLGIFMFWLLGRVVFAAAAMASEERHLHFVASHRDDPGKVGEWLRKGARGTLILLPVIGVGLVAIEAVVERYGIVSTFADKAQNTAIASGATAINPTNTVALWFMVLTVSLPYVLLHMAHGWAYARSKVIHQYLVGRQKLQAWDIAQKSHAERTAQLSLLFDQERAEEETARQHAEEEEAQTRRDAQLAKAQAASEVHASFSGAGIEATLGVDSDPNANATSTANIPEPSFSREETARILARSWEAEQRWRRTRKERHEAIAWYDERIKAYEGERQKESPRPGDVGKYRAEAAYEDYAGALKQFEESYRREARQVERMMQAGILVRLWQALFRSTTLGREGAVSRSKDGAFS